MPIKSPIAVTMGKHRTDWIRVPDSSPVPLGNRSSYESRRGNNISSSKEMESLIYDSIRNSLKLVSHNQPSFSKESPTMMVTVDLV